MLTHEIILLHNKLGGCFMKLLGKLLIKHSLYKADKESRKNQQPERGSDALK